MALSAKSYTGSGNKTESAGAAKPPARARLTSGRASDIHALEAIIGARRMGLETQTELEVVASPEAVAAVTAEVAAEVAAQANAKPATESVDDSTMITEEQIENGLLFPETPAADGLAGISLIELAEVLDQHRLWVESGGESGAKADLSGVNLCKADLTGVNLQGAHLHRTNLTSADLSMANLRGASLVQADMRDTNLLGTELRGANLMGANLYGAEGVWVGRLGGANLFDAILPETVAAFDSSRAIGDATKIARWFYFLMLSLSAICCLLVGFTTDVRLVMNASAIPISRLGNVLPMVGFYLGGPLLLFAIYLRFHFLLLRLWGNMAA